MAESVRVLTKRGMTVENEANPRANPKKPPSSTFTMKLNGKFLFCSIADGFSVATYLQCSNIEVYHSVSEF